VLWQRFVMLRCIQFINNERGFPIATHIPNLGHQAEVFLNSRINDCLISFERRDPLDQDVMFLHVILVLASAFIRVQSAHYELYSELRPDERWFLDDSKLIPVSCENGDCSSLFNKHNKHKIAKRAVVQVETMKDYIKFLLRGNKTKDDETNTEPYRTGNITLGNIYYMM
jgi:hypothetical protein